MAMRWQWTIMVAMVAVVGCGSSGTSTGSGGAFSGVTGGTQVLTGGTVSGGDPNCTTTPGVGPDATGCSMALQCTDVSAGLVPGGLNYCSCSNTGRPPTCDTDPNVCAAYPGTSCTALPGIGSFCAVACTPPATAGTGGVVTGTGGVVTGTGGVVAGTGGMATAPDPACVTDTTATDGSMCPVGLACTDPLSTGNYTCSCPNTSLPPPCTTVGSTTECAAYPGTTCTSAGGVTTCLMACTLPGAPVQTCPDGLSCGDPVGAGASCLASGAVTPPACTDGGSECDAYPGTTCITLPIINTLGCYKQCTVTN